MPNDAFPPFQRLGKVVETTVIDGKNSDSVIFRMTIEYEPGKAPYTIEFFADPGMAMGLLPMLEEIRQRHGYRIPAEAIEKCTIQ